MNIQRHRITHAEIEKQIVTGVIVSTEVCKELLRMHKPEYIQSVNARRIVDWSLNYFKEWNTAPNQHIQDIYNIHKTSLKQADQELCEEYLADLSHKYDANTFNAPYLIKNVHTYYEDRSLELLFEKGRGLILEGKRDEAHELMRNHTRVKRETTQRFRLFDPYEINTFDAEDDSDILFKPRGAVGDLLGALERTWLVSIMAPEKRGKSWILEELAFQSAENRLNTIVFSLEMNKKTVKKRFYGRLTAAPIEPGMVIIPVFDCKLNQCNACSLPIRTNNVPLETDKYSPRLRYKPCTACRFFKEGDYKLATWFTQYEVKPEQIQSNAVVAKKAMMFEQAYTNNFFVRTFPAFSANGEDIIAELDDLESTEGVVPDVVVTDYADIQSEEFKELSERGNVDRTWKRNKQTAAERDLLYITAEQSTKFSGENASLKATDVTEDKRKNAHVDVKAGLNQTPKEKEKGIWRLQVLLHRHKQFNVNRHAVMLTNLDIAQPVIDSHCVMMFDNVSDDTRSDTENPKRRRKRNE